MRDLKPLQGSGFQRTLKEDPAIYVHGRVVRLCFQPVILAKGSNRNSSGITSNMSPHFMYLPERVTTHMSTPNSRLQKVVLNVNFLKEHRDKMFLEVSI